ncbi:partial fengycin family lipopeptide synthetase D, partial [Thermoflexales bacterium]
VLRTDLSGNPTFRAVLQQVREMTLGAYAHQDMPFEMLVEAVQPVRNLSYAPLFQVMFAWQNAPTAFPAAQQDLSVAPLAAESGTAKFDLTLSAEEHGAEIACTLEYSTDLFEAATIARLVEHLTNLLAGIVADVEQRVEALPLLNDDERAMVLREWNAWRDTSYEIGNLSELIEAQVTRTPEAVAVVGEDQHVTYREIDQRASHLARRLQQLGIGPEETVGVCLPRSPEAIISLLAVLKVGGVYVPIDPAYPPERLDYILKDAQASVLITDSQHSVAFNGPVLCMDQNESMSVAFDTGSVPVKVEPQCLAYLIYTSGSTGQPKGVAIPHEALAYHCRQVSRDYRLTADDRVLQFASLSFDASLEQILPPLMAGATVVLREADLWSPADFYGKAWELGLTVINLPPAYWQLVLQKCSDFVGPKHSSLIRLVIIGGDVLPVESLALWEQTRLKDVTLLNAYGPTETTITATTFGVLHFSGSEKLFRSVPIGRPSINRTAYILDRYFNAVPIGVVGELYLGGAGLARGYRNRPELTAEQFVPDPFDAEPGARLYRTGDRARYLPDGNIEFLGRFDHQVKIRGFRIELGEIEAELRRHPAIQETVVVLQRAPHAPEDHRLTAYIVRRPGQVFALDELRQYLQARLPEYMIPAAFVFLDALPLNPNGKVDRRALPIPEGERPEHVGTYVSPRNPIEELVAGVVAAILSLERVGVHDNFFELGGHSLLATQVISRLGQTFEVELPLRSLFEEPTVAGLARQVETARLAQAGRARLPLRPMSSAGEVVLSFAQQRLWFLDQLEPGSPLYNIPAAIRLTGTLNVAALAGSLNHVIARHEVLRTTFHTVEGRPVQVIAPRLRFGLPVVDLSTLAGTVQEQAVRQLVGAEAQTPFDLTRGPLVRAKLLRLGTDEYVLLLTLHHIISDGWSIGILIGELTAGYQALATQTTVLLPELPIQYADYAAWQREWLQGDVLDEQLGYWKQQLALAPALLELPTDRPRSAVPTYRGATYSFVLPAPLTLALKELSRQESVTLFMTLLAGFQTLLSRYTGQRDIVVGTPIANRNRLEIEGLIGFFVNTLVLRTDLSGNPTFRAVLQEVREMTLGAYAHQDVPFEMLVEVLQPVRDLSYAPLFQVMFAWQNAPTLSPAAQQDLSVAPLATESGTAKFDLTLSAQERGAEIACTLEYSTDLFDAATIERLAGHWQMLLEGVVVDSARRVVDMPLLSMAERRGILEGLSGAATLPVTPVCLPALFEAQAQRTPEAEAVWCDGVTVSYRELDQRANCLARYLQRQGVGPETLVGVCVERTIELVVGLLGVLKAGGAYVPLDPKYPPERVEYMLRDASATVLLTQERLFERLPQTNAQVICLDRDWTLIKQERAEEINCTITPEHLAYVIYTSGSTGRPKGVALTHAGAVTLVEWAQREYREEDLRRVLAATSVCFDLSVYELFVPLSCGGCVILVEDALRLIDQAIPTEVTLINTVPSAMRELVRLQALPGSVRVVNLAGEPLGRRLVEDVYAAGVSRVYNLYGPTEDTTYSTYEVVAQGVQPTIGRPVANTRAYILDEALEPVPIGVPGDLYLSGAGLARGYLNRPDLTAEKFIPNPFAQERGPRLYRTGDRARWLVDGRMEFLGRRDHQVKVHGYRIELGEIEARLNDYPGVDTSVVVVHEGEGAEKRLAAYVVPKAGVRLIADELQASLRGRLPEYMVPAALVFLAQMPLTPNGKVDRRALPMPEGERPEHVGTYVAPRNPIEELVAGVMATILSLERVGVHDNFFELGGHSLLATQVISRLWQAFNIELPLRTLFEEPTVAGLARQVETARLAQAGQARLPLRPTGRTGDLVLSYAQQRLWFLDQLEPGSPLYNIPAAIRLEGALEAAVLEESVNQIIQRHETLRTTFQAVEGRPVQVIAPRLRFELPVVDLGTLAGTAQEQAVRQLAGTEAQTPFDLTSGPLLRAKLLRLGVDEYVLLLTLHHIISDGWSIGILIGEITAGYQALATQTAVTLPELPLQYADYAAWQRDWLQGDVLEEQLGYWRRQLAGAPALLELPTDRPRPAVQSYRGATAAFVLPADLSADLKTLSQREGVTLFMTLLAGFQTLLSRYTGQRDIVVGTPIANRNRLEIEGLIGFFVNTLVLRTDLSGNPTFRAVLQQVREMTLGAYAHQDMPFEMLVEALQPVRNLSYAPLFQVMFVWQNAPMPQAPQAGLSIELLTAESGTAKFDLTLSAEEHGAEIACTLEYSTDLFERASIERLAGHWRQLLEGVTTDATQRVDNLSLLNDVEQAMVLEKWNATAADYPWNQCIHELFEEQVERTPDVIAVVFKDQYLTYRELDRRATQLARHLQTLGVGPEELVGLCLERSLDLVIGLLATLKAGGAYVPLDPAYPKDRLAFILHDTQMGVLLTQDHLLENLPEYAGRVICLDRDWMTLAHEGARLRSGVSPAHPAYVIYTSGSTGRPKGIMIQHRSVLNLWSSLNRTIYTQRPASLRVSLNGSISFDTSVKQWIQLLNGHTLYILPEEIRFDIPAFVSLLQQRTLDVLDCTPSQLRLLVDEGLLEKAEGIQLKVLIGGEAIGETLWSKLARSHTLNCYNVYGPTECTVDATLCEVNHLPNKPTLGRPLSNTQIYLVDEYLNLVPIGVPGELCISGAGVARGYWERPDLTAEKFVPDPFSAQAGRRLYRTGDLARYSPDGNIEFLGRIDRQVKIRGFRIELDEIEAVLSQCLAVQEAAVVSRDTQHDPEDRQITAYVVAQPGQTLAPNDLQGFLKDKLPSHMIPAVFILVPALPLTPNGKVNRSALSKLEAADLGSTGVLIAPRDALELQLVQIWEDVLGIRPIGVKHNFFNLGGHSLLTVRLLARIQHELGQSLPLAALFQDATVESLAMTLRRQNLQIKLRSSLVPMQKGNPNKRPLFFVHPGSGSVLCYMNLIRHLGPAQPFYGLQSPGLDDQQSLLASVEAMARHYIDLLRSVQPEGPYLLGGWSMGGVVAFEMARQLQAQNQPVALLTLIDSYPPSNEREPDLDDNTLLVNFALNMGLPPQLVSFDSDPAEPIEFEERLRSLLQRSQQAGLVPPDLKPDRVQQLFIVFKNNVRAMMAYRPHPYSGAVTLLKASQPLDEQLLADDLGWRKWAGEVFVERVPGNHYTLVHEPGVEVLADKLKDCLHRIT